MMNTKNIIASVALLITLIVGITSCVKKKFDNPPDSSQIDPNLPVTHTILQLKQKYTGAATQITEDMTISGIVTADDRSGGFYKQIIIQDSTSGIQINIGQTGLFGDYPMGRKVYIKCKDLYLGAYGNFIQLGYAPDPTGSASDVVDIPWSLIDNYIVKGKTGNTIAPKQVTISELKSVLNTADAVKWTATLVTIDSAEFITSDVGSTYAVDPNISSGVNKTIQDCGNSQLVIRMSSYANYRNALIPSGRGPVTAIFSRFNATAQLLIRDTTDLLLTGTRCGGVVIQPAVDITIDSLRKLHNDNVGIGASAYKIHGVVISSRQDSNISRGNLVIQDESGKGMLVYFGQNEVNRVLGDSVVITLDSLITYAGVMEAKATLSKMVMISSGKTVAPKLVSLATLNADLSQTSAKSRIYESTLVQIANCTITGAVPTYSSTNVPDRSKTVTDPTATITMYSQPTTPFKTTDFPTGVVTITAIASKFNTTNQIQIRQFKDVQE
jgi:hypothetical protein